MNQDTFLVSSLNSKTNLYTGEIPYKGTNNVPLYANFVVKFRPADYDDPEIKELLTAEDLIIKPGCYVFFIGNSSKEKVNSLKLHIIQNFLVNWKEYKKYIYQLLPSQSRYLTWSHLSGDLIYEYTFNKDLLSASDLLSDIQFITLEPHDIQYRNGFYLESIKSKIQIRATSGLITILLYRGSEADFKRERFDEDLLNDSYKKVKLKDAPKTKISNTVHNSNIDSQKDIFMVSEEEVF